MKSVKAITILRSGKVVDIPAHDAKTSSRKANPPPLNGEPSIINLNDDACHIPAHCPYCLLSFHKEK